MCRNFNSLAVDSMAAPIGNQNAAKSRLFDGALRRAIAQDDGKALRAAADSLLAQAASGEAWAIKELADRLDGKAAQAITGDADNPLQLVSRIERVIVENTKA